MIPQAEDLVDVIDEDIVSDTISVDSGSSATSAGSPYGDVYLYAAITQTGWLFID